MKLDESRIFRARRGQGAESVLGGGNEIAVVIRRQMKAVMRPIARAPSLFGGVDLVARGGDEIPPDIARPAHRCASEHDQARALPGCLQRNSVAGAKHKHLPGLVAATENSKVRNL